MNRRLFFLPGAGADPDFWKPLGKLLPDTWEKIYFGWPGLGNQKPDPAVNSLDDLAGIIENSLTGQPVDLLAQSMGGHVAVRVLLKHPEKIRRVVFSATGAGLNLTDFGGVDWKYNYRKEHPHAATWIMDEDRDLSTDLFKKITQPVLILCSDADLICPVKVGERLLQLLPNAKLQIVHGGDHVFAREKAHDISGYIIKHLE
jgi:pimeloyl-ACP methyl ester carboxylesterase